MTTQTQYAFSVSVQTTYLPDQSNAEESKFAFAYTVTITNTGTVAAQLISRHWIITDSNDDVQEVKGLGVVGAQPLLNPNQQFEYTSGTVLNTQEGRMHGSYLIVAVDGTQFEAIIEPFLLTQPRVLH
ncbi:Co2+/Mg2+ efflux protein ApaG [Methylotenera versatilis]|uniref:Co2+/Mg2+ efflux protein ApaG n=1 Tax=Methylotenera versatilis TaxID=1055487 RepID=UPI000646E902|nr:Co2+/Mg2+ efflux protein ApaG [Methylotenera versatilis]